MYKGSVGRTALLSQENGAVVFLAALVEELGEPREELFALSVTVSMIWVRCVYFIIAQMSF